MKNVAFWGADFHTSILGDQKLSAEQKAAEYNLLRQTWPAVNTYLQATGDYDLQHEDPDAYHRVRNSSHNQMIKQLNQLNDLARAHGLKPFTPRNFMTNDFVYEQKRDSGGYLNSRAEYDRETVLGYFSQVFGKDFEVALSSISSKPSRSKVADFYANLR